MTPSDIKIVSECLRAAANGPFFPDQEFSTLFGLERQEVRAIAEIFTAQTAVSGLVDTAVCNSLNNLLGYPHGKENVWGSWISASPSEVKSVLDRWAKNAT